MTWRYVVRNTGSVPLTNIRVVDDQLGAITCPRQELGPEESTSCTPEQANASCPEQEDQYRNVATVTASGPIGYRFTRSDREVAPQIEFLSKFIKQFCCIINGGLKILKMQQLSLLSPPGWQILFPD